MEHSIGAFECICNMLCVANVAPRICNAGVFHHWQQNIENSDAVLPRIFQQQLDDAPADKATAACDYNNWARGGSGGRKNLKFDGGRGGAVAAATPQANDGHEGNEAG